MDMSAKSNRFLLFTLALIWGSSFILIKKGLIGLTAFQLGACRILFTTLFLWIIGFPALRQIKRKQWRFIIATAFFGTFFPAFLFAYAETGVSSGIASILNSLTPINTLWIGFAAFGYSFQRQQGLGIFIGLIGTTLLVWDPQTAMASGEWFYALLVVIASLCYALNINLIKTYLSDCPPLSLIVGNFTIMSVPAVVVLIASGFLQITFTDQVCTSLGYIAILGVVGTGLANFIYFKLIQQSSALYASFVTYYIPIVALMWGFVDGEQFGLRQGLGALIVLLGVSLANRKK